MNVFDPKTHPALACFPVITSLQVQWGEMDAFGHVNNAVYFRWFESARVDYLDQVESALSMEGGGLGPILAAISCRYKRQVKFPDTVHIGSRVSKIGLSSFDVEYALVSETQNVLAATGDSTMVVFDYEGQQPRRMPDAMRQAIEELELVSKSD